MREASASGRENHVEATVRLMTGMKIYVNEFSADAQVQGGSHAGARARRVIERALDGRLPQETLADVSLLVTELVSNGVWHGGADERSSLHLHVSGDDGVVRIEVENPDGADGEPAQRRPDLNGGGGLGLHIVERVASRWGVRRSPRVAVWFELDRNRLPLA